MKPIIAIPATCLLVYRAWSRRSLTPLGTIVAGLTAIVHALHPSPVPFALLVVFFLGGTKASKVCVIITWFMQLPNGVGDGKALTLFLEMLGKT